MVIHGREIDTQPWTQLLLGAPVPARHGGPRREDETRIAAPPRPVSEHLAAPGQQPLFEIRRNWRPVVELGLQNLPSLTTSAQQLLTDLDRVMKEEMWAKGPAFTTRRTVNILVSWLGADAPCWSPTSGPSWRRVGE